jgi:hypothetical protein
VQATDARNTTAQHLADQLIPAETISPTQDDHRPETPGAEIRVVPHNLSSDGVTTITDPRPAAIRPAFVQGGLAVTSQFYGHGGSTPIPQSRRWL